MVIKQFFFIDFWELKISDTFLTSLVTYGLCFGICLNFCEFIYFFLISKNLDICHLNLLSIFSDFFDIFFFPFWQFKVNIIIICFTLSVSSVLKRFYIVLTYMPFKGFSSERFFFFFAILLFFFLFYYFCLVRVYRN